MRLGPEAELRTLSKQDSELTSKPQVCEVILWGSSTTLNSVDPCAQIGCLVQALNLVKHAP
jgi:hypothetical protein